MPNQDSTATNKKSASSIGVLVQRFSSVFILLLLIIIMGFSNENFFRFSNFVNIIRQSSVLGIISMGMTLVILTSGIDLSVGSIMALSGCVMATGATAWNLHPAAAVLLGIAVGTAMGLINGIIITKGKIQAFIATLGMMTTAEGLALLNSKGLPIIGIPESMLAVGSKSVRNVPYSVFVFIAVAVVAWVLLNKTTLGRNVVAVGGNAEAARTSGIRVDRTKIIIHGLSGLFCAVAGFVLMGRLNSSNALMGSGMELLAITAVALGGTSLAGGFGSIGGTVIGIITIGVLNNGLDLMNVTVFWQKIILGIMIVAVIILDSWRKRKFD